MENSRRTTQKSTRPVIRAGSEDRNTILSEIYQVIMDNTQDLIWAVDRDYKLLAANRSFQWAVLDSEGRVIEPGESVLIPTYSAEFLEFWKQSYDRCLTGESFNVVSTPKHLGGPRWMNNFLNPVKDEKGLVMGVLVVTHDITAEKIRESEVLQSEQRLRMITENMHDLLALMDKQGTFIYCNAAYEKILGYDPGTLNGTSSADLLYEEDHAPLNQYMNAFFETGETFTEFEARLVARDGTLRWIEFRLRMIEESWNDNPTILVNGNDITQKKLAEKERKESEFRYRELFSTNPAPMFIFETESLNILEVNEAAVLKYGFTHDEFEQLSLSDIRPKEDVSLMNKIIMNSPQGVYHIGPVRHLKKNGEIFYAELSYNDIHYKGKNCRHVMINDVTERVLADQRIQKLNERITLANRAARIGIWDWDLINDRLEWDDNMYILYNKSNGQFPLTVTSWLEQMHPDDRAWVARAAEEAGKGLREYNIVFRLINPDGKIRYIKAFGDLYHDEKGKPARILGVNYDITESVQQEMSLKQDQKVFTILNELMSDYIFKLTVNEDAIMSMSVIAGNYEEATGRKPGEVNTPSDWSKAIHPDDLQSLKQELNKVLKEKINVNFECRSFNSKGNLRWLEINASPDIYKDSGKVKAIFGSVRNITEKKLAEQALRESEEKARQNEERWRSIIKTSPDGMAIISIEGTILYISDRLSRWHGFDSPDEMLGKNAFDFVDADSRENAYAGLENLLKGLGTGIAEYELLRKNGSRFLVELSAEFIRDKEGNPESIFLIERDITERKAAEQRIVENEKKYRTLFETMVEGVVYQDANGAIISANPSAERILGLTLEQLSGRTSSDPRWHAIKEDGSVFPGEEHPAMIALRTGRPVHRLMGVYHPNDNGYRWIQVNSIPEFREQEEKPFQVYTTFEDITYLKNTLEEINYINRNLENTVAERTREILHALDSLKQSEERFHNMFKNHAAIMMLINPETGEIVEANDAAVAFYGYEMNQGGRKNISEINLFNEIEVKEEMARAARHHLNYFVFPHRLANGEIRNVEVHSTPIEMNHSKLLFSIIHDITERKQAEEALVNSRNTLSQITDSVPVFIALANTSLEYTFINKAYEAFFGTNKEEITGKSVKSVIGEEAYNKAFPFLERALKGEVCTFENFINDTEGNPHILLTSYSPYYQNNTIQGILATVTDITPQVKAAEALKKSEAENRAIISAIPDLLFRIRRDGTYIDAHCRDESMLFVPRQLFLNKKVTEILPPELAKISMDSIEEAFSTGNVIHYEYSLPVSGGTGYFENRMIMISGDEVLSIVRDISDRKHAEIELKETTRKLSTLIKNLQAGTLFENEYRKIYLVNQEFCNQFNIPLDPEQMIGYDCVAASEGSKSMMNDPEGFISRIDEILENKKVVTNEEIGLADGRIFERDYIPIQFGNDLTGHLWQYRDITQRKRNEEYIRIQKELATRLNAVSDFQEALSVILDTMLQIEPLDCGGIYLINPQSRTPELKVHKNLSADFINRFSTYKPDVRQVKLIFEGTPIYGEYSLIIPSEVSLHDRDYIKGVAVIPVKYEEEVVGVINLGSRSTDKIPEHQRSTLEALAIQAGLAISRILAANRLLSSRQNFKMLFETIDDFLFILDIQGRIIFTNPIVNGRLGYNGEELKGTSVLDVHPPARREEAGKIVADMLEGKQSYCPVPLMTRSGSLIPVETRVVHGKWDDQDVLYGISRDITEHQKAEAALRMQSAAFESFALALIITDTNGKIQWANSAFTRLTGYSREEVTGKTNGELTKSGEQNKEFYDQLWKAIKTGKVWTGELINRRKDGTKYPEELTISPVYDHEGLISSFIAIKIDISARKAMERALMESEARWNFALEGSGDGVWDWNLLSKKAYYSPQWKRMFGYSTDEIGTSLDEWESRIHPDDQEQCYMDLQLHFDGESEVYINEHRVLCKDGTYKWILDRGKVVERTEDGKPRRVIGTHTDISRLKEMEEHLLQVIEKEKELNELKSRFVSMTSHEFRTPMATILMSADMMLSYWEKMSQEQIRNKLKNIKEQVQHLTNVVSDVMQVAKYQEGKMRFEPENIDFVKLCRNTIYSFHPDDSIQSRIRFDCEFSELILYIDNRLMQQVLNNLVSNALKYSPADTEVDIVLSEQDEKIILSVSDHGIGIPEEDQKHLFEPFFRASNTGSIQGNGLGLNIVMNSVKMHGGGDKFQQSCRKRYYFCHPVAKGIIRI